MQILQSLLKVLVVQLVWVLGIKRKIDLKKLHQVLFQQTVF